MPKRKHAEKPKTRWEILSEMKETLPVPDFCKDCDLLYPQTGTKFGKQCAAFGVCATGESCGMRISDD